MATRRIETGCGLHRLVLVLVLVLCCPGAESFHTQMTGNMVTSGRYTRVPYDGVYLVTMVADPVGTLELQLMINKQKSSFTVYGHNNVTSGLTVAVPLKKGDWLSVKPVGHYSAENFCGLGVVRVSTYTNNFKTLRAETANKPVVRPYDWTLNPDREWFPFQRSPFIQVKTTGMYWISARPEAGQTGFTQVIIMMDPRTFVQTGLFAVPCHGNHIAPSASGAFYINGNNRIINRIMEDGRETQGDTMLSFVHLDANVNAKVKGRFQNVAYTGFVDSPGKVEWNQLIGFGKARTDYGGLYIACVKRWTIPASGVYIVSIRPAPVGEASLSLRLLHNDRQVFAAFAEKGQPSGQDAVFFFHEGDWVEIKPNYPDGNESDIDIGSSTMMSIAFAAFQ